MSIIESENPGYETAALEELNSYFEKLYPIIADSFNVDTEKVEKPEVLTLGETLKRGAYWKDTFFQLGYEPNSNWIVLNENVKADFTPSDVGEEIAHHLRSKAGPGDRIPQYESVAEFFGRIGCNLAAETYGTEVEEPSVEMLEGRTIPEDMKFLIRNSEYAFDDVLRIFLSHLAHYAGSIAADEHWREAIKDKKLIYRDSEEIREKYGIVEKEREAIRQAF